jgi:serine/threonine protein kinase
MYVTKIANDAPEEYDVGTFIASLVGPSIGVFPADPLYCGISKRILGPTANEIISKCQNIVDFSPVVSPGSYFDGGSAKHKTKSKYKESLIKQSLYRKQGKLRAGQAYRQRAGSEAQAVCGIQYERYFSDFSNKNLRKMYERYLGLDVTAIVNGKTLRYILDKENFGAQLYSLALEKLYVLHANNIFHLDIKGPNLALMNPLNEFLEDLDTPQLLDIRFADFGLAVYAKTYNDIANAAARSLQDNFWIYYFVSLPDASGLSKISIREEDLYRKMIAILTNRKFPEDTKYKYLFVALRIIDTACLYYIFAPYMTKTSRINYESQINRYISQIPLLT